MRRLILILIVPLILAGCADRPVAEADAAAAPRPGTVRVHMNGTIGAFVGGSH
jgi:hypothetical protein